MNVEPTGALQGGRPKALEHDVTAEGELVVLRLELEAACDRADSAQARLIPLAERLGAAEFERGQLLRRAQAAERSVGELTAAHRRQELAIRAAAALRDRILKDVAGQEQEDAGLLQLARWAAGKRVLLGLLRRSGPARLAILQAQANILGIGASIRDHVLPWLSRQRVLFGLLRRSGSSAEAVVGFHLLRAAQLCRGHALLAATPSEKVGG